VYLSDSVTPNVECGHSQTDEDVVKGKHKSGFGDGKSDDRQDCSEGERKDGSKQGEETNERAVSVLSRGSLSFISLLRNNLEPGPNMNLYGVRAQAQAQAQGRQSRGCPTPPQRG
jgi:hypothetical protein